MTTLVPSPSEIYIPTLLGIARAELGVRESDNNSGSRVMEYQAATTLGGTHWPWCAAFVCWLLKRLAKKLGIIIPWSNSADCDVILADARNRGLLRSTPQPGDVFLVRAKLDNGNYSKTNMIHTGIVEAVHTNGTFDEIAGNTNEDGSREGIEVGRNTHPISARYYFVRPLDAVQIPAPAPVATAPTWNACVQLMKGGSGSNVRSVPSKLLNGSLWIPIRAWGAAVNKPVIFDVEHQSVSLGGKELPSQRQIIDNQSYYQLETLALFCKGSLLRDEKSLTATAVIP